MQTVTLYKYYRPDGGLTVSPIEPDADYTIGYRIIADEGKVLTQNGVDYTCCVDVDSAEGWYEMDEPEEEEASETE